MMEVDLSRQSEFPEPQLIVGSRACPESCRLDQIRYLQGTGFLQ